MLSSLSVSRLIKHVMYTKTITILQTCDIDIEVELQEISQAAPVIVVTGVPGEETCEFWICGEKVTFHQHLKP